MFERVAGKQGDDLIGARQSEMRALVGRQMGNVGSKQPDRTGICPQVAADLVEQRGLAGAVRADDQAALTRPDRERNVLRYREATERFLQVDDLNCVAGWGGGHRAPLRNRAVSLLTPGTTPVGITSTMNRNTNPSSMFHRSR